MAEARQACRVRRFCPGKVVCKVAPMVSGARLMRLEVRREVLASRLPGGPLGAPKRPACNERGKSSLTMKERGRKAVMEGDLELNPACGCWQRGR